jgi:hypothetical protein
MTRRSIAVHRSTIWFAILARNAAVALLALLFFTVCETRSATAAVDLTGEWKLDANGQPPDPYFNASLVNFTQSGTMLTFMLPGQVPFNTAGSIDPDTGEFSTQFYFVVFFSTCAAAIEGVASTDGLSFTGTYQSSCPLDSIFVGPVDVTGQRCGQGGVECCGNGITESGELCDGVCCDSTCHAYDPSGTACTNDSNVCTNDVCDGAGSCRHDPLDGLPCGPDGPLDYCKPKGLCAGGACEIVPCLAPSSGSKIVMGDDVRGTHWVWRDDSGAVTGFGDPTASGDTHYRVCLGPQPSWNNGINSGPGIQEAWRPITGGFRYRETSNLVRSVLLRARNGRTTVKARMSGYYPLLPTSLPITMRVLGVGAVPSCFEMTYSNPTVNSENLYKARE